jgi:hypothetical protein
VTNSNVYFYNILKILYRVLSKPLQLENLSILNNDSKTLLLCLQSLTVGSDMFLKLFTKLALCTTPYEGMNLIESVIVSINRKKDHQESRKLTQQRLSSIRKSAMTTSTTSFGAANLIEDTDKQTPRITINRRNSKIDGSASDSIFTAEYSNYFWAERGFLNMDRKLFRDVASFIEMKFKTEREAMFQFYESPVNAFVVPGSQLCDEDEFVLSSDEDDELSDRTEDDHTETQKLVSDMEGTLFSCNDFYRLVFNDELETQDIYSIITHESDVKNYNTNGWFLAGPAHDYCPTRHMLSALVAARILLSKRKANNIAPMLLLESLYKICAMFQFMSLRVNLLCVLLMNEIEIASEVVMDLTTQILQQMNTALRKRFQFTDHNQPLTLPERTFLYHYTNLWYKVITKLRFSTFFQNGIENCDQNSMLLMNQICRIKLLSVLLPLPDLAVLIRVLHYNATVQQKETFSMEYQLFGREKQQVFSVFPNESFESIVKENCKEATYHQINSHLVSIIGEYIVLDHFNLYNILDFVARLEVNTVPLRSSLFQGILDLQSHLKERNDLEQIMNETIIVFETATTANGPAIVMLTDTGVITYTLDPANRYVLKESMQQSYADLKIEYQRHATGVKITPDVVINNGRKVLEILRQRCHESQFSHDKASLSALGNDIPEYGSRVVDQASGQGHRVYVSDMFLYVVDDNTNKLVDKYPRKNVKLANEAESPYGLGIKTAEKDLTLVFPSDRSKVDFISLWQ